MNASLIRKHSVKLLFWLVFLVIGSFPTWAQSVRETPEGYRMEVRVGLRRAEVLPGEPALVAVDCTFSKTDETVPESGRFVYTPAVSAKLVSLTVLDADGNDARPNERPGKWLSHNVISIDSTSVQPDPPRNVRTIYLLSDWVTLRKPGTYRVRIQIQLRAASDVPGNDSFWTTTQESRLTVLPNDDGMLGELIEDIGHDLSRDSSGLNLERLIRFDDPRIIPFLLDALIRLYAKVPREPPTPPQAQRVLQNPSDGPILVVGPGLLDLTPNEIGRICEVLIRFPQKDAIDAVTEVARSPYASVRNSLASTLQRSKRPASLTILGTMWNDPSDAVRVAVAEGLAFDSNPETLSILQKLLEDKEESVRLAAQQSLETRRAAKPR